MLKNIKINFDTVEMMVFFWESMMSREKVIEAYLIEVSEKEDMKPLYNDEFTKDSVRKVLSAISNRELVNHPTKAESRFWNNNMRMLEDRDNMNFMLKPVKTLNLDYLKDEFKGDTKFEEIQVYFIPGHLDKVYIDGNKLYVNFFSMSAGWENPEDMKIDGMSVKEFVEKQVREML